MYKTVIRPLTDLQFIKKSSIDLVQHILGISDLKYTMLKVEFIGSYRSYIQIDTKFVISRSCLSAKVALE